MPRPAARAVAAAALALGAAAAEAAEGRAGQPRNASEPGGLGAVARSLAERTWVNGGYTCRVGDLPDVPHYRPEGPKVQVRVLTFNLFWWMLFDKGKPGQLHWHLKTPGNGATALINHNLPFDVMGFTECFDERWLMQHAGLATEYKIFRDRACCMAYRHTQWDFISKGVDYPTADKYGRRPAQWMRLKHKGTGQVVFFTNHHGPLPLNSGGMCGPGPTVYRMLQLINKYRGPNDAVISVGDFNADGASDTVRLYSQHLHPAFSSGLDRVFANLPPAALLSTRNLGSGGSDHDALAAVFQLGGAAPAPPPGAAAEEEPPHGYQALAHVALDEGGPAGDRTARHYSVAECAAFCDKSPGCHSFSYAGSTDGWCHLKDKCVASSDPVTPHETPYRTYYKPCAKALEVASEDVLRKPAAELGRYAATDKVLLDEGGPAGDHADRHYSVAECSAFCDSTPGCHSFSYAGSEDGWCHLKTKCVMEGDPMTPEPTVYRTYYKPCTGLEIEDGQSSDPLFGGLVPRSDSPLVGLAGLPPSPQRPQRAGLEVWPQLFLGGSLVFAIAALVHRHAHRRFSAARAVAPRQEGGGLRDILSSDESEELLH